MLTKSFRLPGLLSRDKLSDAPSTIGSGRRVHMYLPPPPNAPSGVSSIAEAIRKGDRGGYKAGSDDTSSSFVETQVVSNRLVPSSKSQDAEGRATTSEGLVINIDVQTVRKKYPAKRAFLREVFRFFMILSYADYSHLFFVTIPVAQTRM